MSLSSFGDNGRNRGNNKLSPNMLLLLVGIFVILPMSGLFGLLWTAVAAFLLVKQAKKQGGERRKALRPPVPPAGEQGPCPVHIRASQAHISECHQTHTPKRTARPYPLHLPGPDRPAGTAGDPLPGGPVYHGGVSEEKGRDFKGEMRKALSVTAAPCQLTHRGSQVGADVLIRPNNDHCGNGGPLGTAAPTDGPHDTT